MTGLPQVRKWGRRTEVSALRLMCGPSKLSVDEVRRNHFPLVSTATLYRWKLHFKEWCESPTDTAAWVKVHLRKWRKGPVTRELVEFIRSTVDEAPHLYLDEIQVRVQRKFGKSPSISTIWRILRHKLNYTLRVYNEKASQRDEELRHEFRIQLAQTSDPARFIFVDETAKDRNASRRRRAWAPRGQDNSISKLFAPHNDFRYTLLAAADINGFVDTACEMVLRASGAADTDTSHGTIDADRFVEWVQHYLVPVLGRDDELAPRSVVVMDNATIHMDLRVRELIEGAGAQLIFTAPYSPDLNPIERCFHQYKAFLKRHHELANTMPMRAHQLAMAESVSPSNMRAYYRAVGCIRNVPAEDPPMSDVVAVVTTLAIMVAQRKRKKIRLD